MARFELVSDDRRQTADHPWGHELHVQILAHVRSSVIVTDLNGRITYWNRGAEGVFGYTAEEMLGRTPADLYPEQDQSSFGRDLARILQGEDYEAEWKGRHRDGRELWVLVSTSRMLDAEGKPSGFIGVGTDVTARKRAEREREQLLADLAREKARAESASRAKDEFLAMLGHELRNPLSPIVTALHLMKRRGEGALEKERTVIERQVQHMVRLVDDLLDISRVTRGKVALRKERTELSSVVTRALEMTSPILEERGHRLEVVVPRHLDVLGDEDRLAQVVANLLTNAAKYTPPAGQITVHGSRDGDHVTLRVVDNGEGIPATLLPRLFDLFTQGERTLARPQGGLGLGLALVKGLVELHGGTVDAASAGAGEGSEFVVRLPALDGTGNECELLHRPPQETLAALGARVLIVDDNLDSAEVLSELLSEHGYATQVVCDAQQAMHAVRAERPDLAILDIGLPGVDGYALARELKRAEPQLPLVALTGYGQRRDRTRALESGFDDHVVKPPDLDQLLGIVGELLSRTGAAASSATLPE